MSSKEKKKKTRKRFIKHSIMLVLVVLMIFLFFLKNSYKDTKMENNFEKVLIIGIDGMDPKITNKLIKEGKLPNFKKLSESGSFLNLNTSYPPVSPVAWTSI